MAICMGSRPTGLHDRSIQNSQTFPIKFPFLELTTLVAPVTNFDWLYKISSLLRVGSYLENYKKYGVLHDIKFPFI